MLWRLAFTLFPSTLTTAAVRRDANMRHGVTRIRHAWVLAVGTILLASPANAQLPVAPTERWITVASGVRLHVLDWVSSGPAVVLLAGLGGSAFSYQDLVPTLPIGFRYVAVTRRGTMPSSLAEHGYELESRVRDDIAVLDSLAIGRGVFVGHSIAGSELAILGTKHPERVAGLVFLDAAYDRSRLGRAPRDTVVGSAIVSLLAREDLDSILGSASRARRNNLRATLFDSLGKLDPAANRNVEIQQHEAERHISYRGITAPMLGVFAFSEHNPLHRLFPADSSRWRDRADEWWRTTHWPWQLRQIARFQEEATCGRIAILYPASHQVLETNLTQTSKLIAEFLRQLSSSAAQCDDSVRRSVTPTVSSKRWCRS